MLGTQGFRDYLSELVDLLGYSQREIADHCGVSQQSVSRWRSGASIPSSDRIAELVPVLNELELVARDRLRSSPTPMPLKLARFLRDRRLHESLAELFPPAPGQPVLVGWNADYQAVADDLVSRVPLLQISIPLGHGISTLARYTEERIRSSMADVVCIRIGVEQLAALGEDGKSERDAYRSFFYGLYDPDEILANDRGSVLAAGDVPLAVARQIQARTDAELRRDDYRRILGTNRHQSVLEMLDESSTGWRSALGLCGMSVQVIVILDLSPSPLGRTYMNRRDAISSTHADRAQAMVDAAAANLVGVPRLSFLVLIPQGDLTELAALETAVGATSWEVLPGPPRLERSDFFEILAAHAGASRVELEAAIEPRFSPDLGERGIASTSWEFTSKLNAVLSPDVDNAGVVRENDLSSSDAVLIRRLTNLERQVFQIEEMQVSILDAIGELRRTIGGIR